MRRCARRKRGLFRPAILTLTLCLAMAGAVRAGRPTEEVRTLIDEVLRILQTQPSRSPAEKLRRVELIQQATNRRLDYREMAQRSLGPTWNGLSTAQQEEFVHLFSELLKSAYAERVDEFAQAKVAYQSEENSEDLAEVRIQILRQNDRIPVTFRMLHGDRGWMIYDLVIEGVSLVSNYRSQFGRIIQGSSYQALVRCLQVKLKADACLRAEAPGANADTDE